MWLVICDATDRPALWAGAQLRRIGLPVQFLAPQELLSASHLEYRAEAGKPAYGYAKLLEDRVIDTRLVRGTLNRATRQACPQVRFAQRADQSYVQAEMDAMLLAWLATLPSPVFNPATAGAWSGVTLSAFAWAMHAQAAGFQTLPYRCGLAGLEYPQIQPGNLSTHIVFAGQTYPALPQALTEAACALAGRVDVSLLGITLAWSQGLAPQAIFIEASSLPDLRVGGSAFIAALSGALQTEAGKDA